MAVLTAEKPRGDAGNGRAGGAQVPESARVQQARARGAASGHRPGTSRRAGGGRQSPRSPASST